MEMLEMVDCNGWPFWASVVFWGECGGEEQDDGLLGQSKASSVHLSHI